MAKQPNIDEFGDEISSNMEEPMVSYGSNNLRDTYFYTVSDELFRRAISQVVTDIDTGLTIPNSQIDNLIKNAYVQEIA